MFKRHVIPRSALRNVLQEVEGISSLEHLLVRAFAKDRGLSIRRNALLQASMDQAESPDGFLEILHRLEIPLEFPLIDRLLEGQLSRTDRKSSGVVYTPEYVVRYICHRSAFLHRQIGLGNEWVSGRVLDPAVGAGAFLIGMAEHLRQTTRNRPSAIVERQLFGVDINPNSIRITELLLNLWTLQAGEDIPGIRVNLLTDDSLSGVPLFRRFGLESGFDAVIGNPPYVRIQNLDPAVRERLRRRWNSAEAGNIDIYIPFIELGLSEISETGIVGYIVPTTFTTTEAGRSLREILSKEMALLEFYDFGHHQVFEEAITYSCLLLLSRQRTERFRYFRADTAVEIPSEPRFDTISVQRLSSRRWQLYSDNAHQTIRSIESTGVPLGETARIGAGIATLADGYYLLDGDVKDSLYVKEVDGQRFLVEPEITKPILKASRLKSEEDIRSNRGRILFPYRKVGGKQRIIPEKELRSEFPNAYAYLSTIRKQLDIRDRGKPNPVAWYAFGRSQGLNSNFGRQLLTSGLNLSSNFLLCEDENTTFYAGYCIQAKNGQRLRVLQKILNSPLLDFYIHETSRSYQQGYKSFAKVFLEKFGIPRLSDDDRRTILLTTNPPEFIVFLLTKYGLNLSEHSLLASFLEQSPKMKQLLPRFTEEL